MDLSLSWTGICSPYSLSYHKEDKKIGENGREGDAGNGKRMNILHYHFQVDAIHRPIHECQNARVHRVVHYLRQHNRKLSVSSFNDGNFSLTLPTLIQAII